MNVLLVSQCNKNALARTRRILDQFAERRGDRTWQTAITLEGLKTLRKLLKQSARKNTAVACHWIRGSNHSELMWIVGDASRFNEQGAVPTNATQNDVLRTEDENDWHKTQSIRLLAKLAGLLHDLGKASVAFQKRLKGELQERNLYRHEWVSLRLFQAFVGMDDDSTWLKRLAQKTPTKEQDWLAPERLEQDGIDAKGPYPLADMPPLAQAIGWLIVSHHRMPSPPAYKESQQQRIGTRSTDFKEQWLKAPWGCISHTWNEIENDQPQSQRKLYWQMAAELPVCHPKWHQQVAKTAQELLEQHPNAPENWLDNPFVMHLARLSLMLSDHYYSSLGLKNDLPVPERQRYLVPEDPLKANTTYDSKKRNVAKQTLTEHLIGVARGASGIARSLPEFERYLPRLARHRGLKKRTKSARFAWQDKAYDKALGISKTAPSQGAFVINMASTGKGKTIANARIAYALAGSQQGMRLTYALGLRTLTLQTGQSYRRDLHLDEDELAIMVGGAASRALFEYYHGRSENSGSESAQALIEEDCHVLYEGAEANHPLLSRAMADPAVRKLLSAPVLSCTVDHLVPATESLRGGRQIAPMLRLMSSDLVLDELDDYGLEDLPALTRLMYWAGLLGSRVILSSATLPAALVEGMFQAYQTGRKCFSKNRHLGRDATQIACLWTDEFRTVTVQCPDKNSFLAQHQKFIDKRIQKLVQAEPVHQAELMPIEIAAKKGREIYAELAEYIRDKYLQLHKLHGDVDPSTGKRVSLGIIRIANINKLLDLAQALYAQPAPDDTQVHLCVYHSRFPLLQRSAIEQLLDTFFNRKDASIFERPQIAPMLESSSTKNVIFIVLASPVCEVGRDWDADWAIAEPSSVRALIQLAGRVQRHRRRVPSQPNIILLDAPISYFLKPDSNEPIYIRPGFEDKDRANFRVQSPWLHDLLDVAEYQVVSAIPRIQITEVDRGPYERLSQLEQARMQHAMRPESSQAPRRRRRRRQQEPSKRTLELDEAAVAWAYPYASFSGVLPQQQPFRRQTMPTETLTFLPDEDELTLMAHRLEKQGRQYHPVSAESLIHRYKLETAEGVSNWGNFDLLTLLQTQAAHQDKPIDAIAPQMTTVEVPCNDNGWYWHPWLGLWK